MADPWLRDIPAIFRTLADHGLLRALPRPSTGPLEQACATWGALHYVLSSLLGWSEPGRGLAWWYAAGKPVDDSPVLELVREVWGADDLIDYYAAWCWLPKGAGYLHTQAEDPSAGPSPTWLAQNSLWHDEDWWRAFVRRGRVHHHDPFYGGSDPLHLQIHSGPLAQNPSGRAIAHLEHSARRVVLVVPDLDHWLVDLEDLQGRLPPVGERSWRVEVFDRQIGYLGEYRRSRKTGGWFIGRHAIHARGNALDPSSTVIADVWLKE